MGDSRGGEVDDSQQGRESKTLMKQPLSQGILFKLFLNVNTCREVQDMHSSPAPRPLSASIYIQKQFE